MMEGAKTQAVPAARGVARVAKGWAAESRLEGVVASGSIPLAAATAAAAVAAAAAVKQKLAES